MYEIIKKNKFFTVFIVVICLVSCDAKQVFDQYKSIPNSAWKKNQTITFDFFIKDTISPRNLFFNIRNNNDYPFSNLFVISKMIFPDKQQIIDTLEYDMADASGKFLGSGFSEIKENKLLYKENIVFPKKGNYSLEIKQAMRKGNSVEGVDALKGITEVGFRIEKINTK
ncbi:gliding motility lipoprotein GldH [Tenacibaculum sp. UWU-22]|uniref:gliding motility lipoprotein GldH n=1 Tax=Tenacibaculum sp. UWU-22 TaxID=3234187 RepID=UPI0034DAC96C